MGRIGLDMYDDLPRDMMAYLRNYGYHFNKKAFDYAVKHMKGRDGSSFTPWTKEEVDSLMSRNGVRVEHDVLYDVAFVANMAKSDFYKSSISDEARLCLWVKDYIDDSDQEEGFVFVRWYASMMHGGHPIEWGDML